MVLFYYKDTGYKLRLDFLSSSSDYDKLNNLINDFIFDKIYKITYNEPLELEILQNMFALKQAHLTSMFCYVLDEVKLECED